MQSKRYSEALKLLDDAAAQPKADADFLVSVAGLYLRLGVEAPDQHTAAKSKARAVLERAEKLNSSNPTYKLQLAEGFDAVGDYGKAAEIYLELLKNLPDVPLIRERVHARLTDIYLHSEDRKRAAEQLQAIIKDDPTNPQAYYWLGNIALDQKQYQEAADDFNRCLLLKSDFEPAYYDLALAQLNLDKPGEALATLEKARSKFPTNFSLEFWTGMALSRKRRIRKRCGIIPKRRCWLERASLNGSMNFFIFKSARLSNARVTSTRRKNIFKSASMLLPILPKRSIISATCGPSTGQEIAGGSRPDRESRQARAKESSLSR